MSKKDEFNQACRRLTDADHRLGVLASQMKQARERAIECVSKARSAARTLPVDSDITEHAAAAAARARDVATIEGERVYWAELYSRSAAAAGAAREEVAAAERDLVRIEDAFWRERFDESCAAFFQRNRSDLRDMFGVFARVRRTNYPDLEDFFDAVVSHGPKDADELRPGIAATARVLAPPARAGIPSVIVGRSPDEIRRQIKECEQGLANARQSRDDCGRDLNGPQKAAAEKRMASLGEAIAERQNQLDELQKALSNALLETEALSLPKA